MRRTLATRLATAVVALGSAFVLVGGVLSYRSASATLRTRVLAQLEADAADGADHLTNWLERQRAALIVNAQAYTHMVRYLPARPDSLPLETLPQILLSTEELQLIGVPSGRVIRSTNLKNVGSYAQDEQFYRGGRNATYIQGIYYSGSTGRPRLAVAAPIRAPGDSVVRAVLAAHLDLSLLENAIGRQFTEARQPGAPLPVTAYLVNEDADFVSAKRFGRAGVKRGVYSVAIDRARAGGSGTALYANYEGRPVIGSWRWIPALELALIVESPQEAAFAPARRLLVNTLLIGLLGALVLAWGLIAITRRFTDPVVLVANAATRVASGDFGVTVPESGRDEAAQLGRAFNTMTGRLQSVYASLETQVTATREALDEVRRNRELLRDLLDNTALLVLVLDLEGRIRLANRRAADLGGIGEDEAAGRTLESLYGAAARPLEQVLTRARDRQLSVEQELELATPRGSHGWQVVCFPLTRDDGETYAYGIVGTDLTERARAEGERRARDASVQQAQKLESLGVMAGGIAHDFNNILGAIIGNAELAREALSSPPTDIDEAVGALERINSAGRRAAELTRQMLAYAGRASLRHETIDLRQVIGDMLPIVRASQSKKVRFDVAPMPQPLWVACDPSQLSQVVLNLLTNAAEAIGDATGTVALEAVRTITPTDASDEAWVRLSVIDTGPGIPADVQSRIFDPFFSTKESGRGLGLSAVRGIVRSLGGSLQLESKPGRTRFDIYLRPEVGMERATAPEPAPMRDLAGTLLVIDDEMLIRQLVSRIAQRMGLDVLEADDGETGLRLFFEHARDVSAIMLDLTMPGMNGAEVLAHVRRTHPHVPVIVMSGYDADDALATIGEDSALSFLQKPFSPELLRGRITEALRPRVG
ncbi:MAG: response regulator [Gemmatimonadaceae bacterium]|nr:response regulator [Gemmatimonadaceae bacterium]